MTSFGGPAACSSSSSGISRVKERKPPSGANLLSGSACNVLDKSADIQYLCVHQARLADSCDLTDIFVRINGSPGGLKNRMRIK